MPQGGKRTEVLVGFFVLVGLLMLGGLILNYGRGSRLGDTYAITVEFRDASGVIKGGEVRLGGAKIGEVAKAPELVGTGKVNVTLNIREDTPQLPDNAVFLISSLSLLGDKAIVIKPPKPGEESPRYIEDGDIVKGGLGGFDAVQDDIGSIAGDARILMGNMRTTLDKVDATLDSMRAVTGRLSDGIEQINNGILSDENVESVSVTLASLKATGENLEQASNELGPVMKDVRAAIATVENAAGEARLTFAKANQQIDALEPAIEDVPEVMASLNETAKSVARAADRASDGLEGDGLIGTLAYDKEVKTDAATFIRNLRHYGILRYRDDESYDESDPRDRYRGRRR